LRTSLALMVHCSQHVNTDRKPIVTCLFGMDRLYVLSNPEDKRQHQLGLDGPLQPARNSGKQVVRCYSRAQRDSRQNQLGLDGPLQLICKGRTQRRETSCQLFLSLWIRCTLVHRGVGGNTSLVLMRHCTHASSPVQCMIRPTWCKASSKGLPLQHVQALLFTPPLATWLQLLLRRLANDLACNTTWPGVRRKADELGH
jgi:hypothetical protein